jgi:hypothetical protein
MVMLQADRKAFLTRLSPIDYFFCTSQQSIFAHNDASAFTDAYFDLASMRIYLHEIYTFSQSEQDDGETIFTILLLVST